MRVFMASLGTQRNADRQDREQLIFGLWLAAAPGKLQACTALVSGDFSHKLMVLV